MSVSPYSIPQLPLHRLSWNLIFEYFLKICQEDSVPLKLDNNNGYFTWWPMHIFDHTSLTHFFFEWQMFQTKVVENIKTHILCSITFFKNCLVYAITWKQFVEPGRPQITTWHTHIACWIPKATNTLSEYVIVTDFALQKWLHKHTSVLHYTYTACLV